MKLAKSLFKENRVFYYITLIIWLSSSVCGVLCALHLEGASFGDISSYVNETMSAEMSIGSFIKLGIGENVKFLIILLLCSSAPVFLPLTFALTAFKGFSAGFTSAIIIRLYSLKGALVSLGAVVLPYTFSMPIIFMMIVSSLRFSLGKTQRKSSYYTSSSREWFSYISFQLVLTSLLSLVTVAESFISKLLTGLVN